MKISLLFLMCASAFLASCGGSGSSSSSATNSLASNAPAKYNLDNPATAVPNYLGTVVQAEKSSVKTIDVSYLKEAIQQFNVQEGRYPKNLQELVPNYVAKVPAAPYGYKIVYDASDGTVSVVKQ
jgi:hypothetical protein